MRRSKREQWTAIAFIAPAVLLIGLFVIWPTARMYLRSFATPPDSEVQAAFTVRNYAHLFSQTAFAASVRNTLLFTALTVPAQTALALLMAVWVNGAGLSRRFLRLAVFIPTTISLAVLSVVWKLMYTPQTSTGAGLINGLLGTDIPFLTSEAIALPSLVLMSVWQGVGLQMLVFLSGLQQIQPQLYEAAALDGADAPQRFINVTLPGIAPTATFVVTVTTIFALKLFVQPFLMTRGGPDNATISVVQYMYESAFYGRDIALACAAGGAFFIGVLAITLALRRLTVRAEALE